MFDPDKSEACKWAYDAEEQAPEYWDAEAKDALAEWLTEPEQPQKPHPPECACDVCYYGADLAKWINQPGEY